MTLNDLQVIYEDNHLIAVNKPSGALSQKDETNDEILADVVKHYIKIRYDKPGDVFLGIVHRLDRPTSGAIVFARTSKALERMNKMFADQEIQKTYFCVTKDRPDPIEGHLEQYLMKDAEKNFAHVYTSLSSRNKGAKLAVLDYELVGNLDNYCLIKAMPHTGRQHQIRAQLASIGCPIIGDVKYGSKEKSQNERMIYLHCHSMSFLHPVKKEPVVIEASLPRDWLWGKMRKLVSDFEQE